MRYLRPVIFAAGFALLGRSSPAHANAPDVSPRLVSGQIATYSYDDAGGTSALSGTPQHVFGYNFGDFPNPYFDTDPGIHALASTSGYTPSGLPPSSFISFDVLSDLKYWSGTDPVSFVPVPGGETLTLQLGSSMTVGTGPGFYPGFVVGNQVDPLGGFHQHLTATLQAGQTESAPADGIYLIEMHLNLLQLQPGGTTAPYPGVKSSVPFFVLYNNNMSLFTTFPEAVTWVQNNLVPFGDFNRDHQLTTADIPALLSALTDLNAYKSANNLSDFDLQAFGDINGDGKINNSDIQPFLDFFAGGGMQVVPEPSSLALLVVGGLSLPMMIIGRLTNRRGSEDQ